MLAMIVIDPKQNKIPKEKERTERLFIDHIDNFKGFEHD